jgi:hypothetical protein
MISLRSLFLGKASGWEGKTDKTDLYPDALSAAIE